MDARRLIDSGKYEEACENLWREIREKTGNMADNISGKRILVIGTEEFMFPALYIGRKMEKEGAEVRCHSTTRSPIAVSLEKEYPLHSRYELKSLYDPDRRTFIYDIGKYDKVLIVTDSPEIKESQETLINAVRMQNKDITVVRWCLFEKFLFRRRCDFIIEGYYRAGRTSACQSAGETDSVRKTLQRDAAC